MTSRPIVLFVGDDASSTQIAESLLRRLVGDRVEILTAGAQQPTPGGREDQMLVMMGLNPAHEERLSVRVLNSADRVIILGATLDVARLPGRRYEEWDPTTDDLGERVENLAAELTSSITSGASVEGGQEEPRWRARHLRGRVSDGVARKLHQLVRRIVGRDVRRAQRGGPRRR